MLPDPEQFPPGSWATLKVLDFLREFDRIRQPPTRHLSHYDFVARHKDFPLGEGCESNLAVFGSEEAVDQGGRLSEAVLLRVAKQTSVLSPEVPRRFTPWLVTDGSNPDLPPTTQLTRRNLPPEATPGPDDLWTTEPGRETAFKAWIDTTWTPWAEAERQRRRVQKFYERLFERYLQLKRDAEQVELVWGYGLLSWQADGDDVWHPLILGRVEMAFDRTEAVITVHPTSAVPELASEILTGAGPEFLDEFRRLEQEYRKSPIAPWDLAHSTPFLRVAANCLGTGASVVDNEATPSPSPTARIVPDGVLFLRRRRSGYARDIEAWQQLLRDGHVPAEPVSKVVGVHDTGQTEPGSDAPPIMAPMAPGADSWRAIGEELLFPLPANEEQREIAQRLARHAGVTVQGPPGCGKTHGVANLICHLLAHGKTVLVTAQTDRALRVLRAKVPKAIRSLCVSVLGSDLDAQEELRESVATIVSRIASGNSRDAAETERARAELKTVRTELAELWGKMGAARRAERQQVTIGGRSWTPSAIGEYLRAQAEQDGWIPDAIAADAPMPLSEQEIQELFGTLGSHGRKDLVEGMRNLPAVAVLPTAEEFRARLHTLRTLRERLAALPADLARWTAPAAPKDADLPALLQGIRTDLERALEDLEAFEAPWIQIIRQQIGNDPKRIEWWQEVVKDVRRRQEEIFAPLRRIRAREIKVSLRGALDDSLAAMTALRDYVAGGGSFGRLAGLLHGAVKQTRDACRVDGHPPNSAEECEALLDYLTVQKLRFQLGRLAANELGPLGVPPLQSSATELEIEPLVSTLQKLLGWRENTWAPLTARLAAANCRVLSRSRSSGELPPPGVIVVEEHPGDEVATVQAILAVLAAALTLVHLADHERWKRALGDTLTQGAARPDASVVWRRLRDAYEAEDVAQWRQTLEEISRLWAIRPGAERFVILRGRLKAVAPQWAAQLLDLAGNPQRAVVPPRLAEAWIWRQLETWLTVHLRMESAESLRRKIDVLHQKERRLIEAQVTHATWAKQITRVQPKEQEALMGWQQTIQRLGRGTVRRAGELKREAQRLMSECRGAVPVWIMPLARVCENFAPGGHRFDIVITDESSQMDSYGILALLRAERAIVIGDDQQISPAAVGVETTRVKELMDKHLEGIPSKHLYDGQQSLYDMATRAFGGIIRLREHFRSMPEIIGFSNGFYNNEIRPLRDPASSTLLPAVVLRRIPGYRTPDSKLNLVEADEVARLIAACCQHPKYEHCTIGAISLLGEDQARAIYERVRQYVSEAELDRRAFMVGDAYYFQGDERDVMFLSLVETGEGRFAALTKKADQQRFNVAASRAKDQMWIVHSVDPNVFHEQDLRGRLLRFYSGEGRRIENWKRVEEVLASKTPDDEFYFQRLVARAIVDRGYAVRAEVRVGHFRIDLVVDGTSDSLAVECDGDRWHPLEKTEEDIARQLVLERMGWRFVRIRGGEYFRHPEKVLEPLWRRLEELGIHPVTVNGDPTTEDDVAKEILALAETLKQPRSPESETPASAQPAPSAEPTKVVAEMAPSRPRTGARPVLPLVVKLEGVDDQRRVPPPESRSRASLFEERLGAALRLRLPEEYLQLAAKQVLEWLRDNPEWHGRAEILAGSGVAIEDWQNAIGQLLNSKYVEATGYRRLTQYRASQSLT